MSIFSLGFLGSSPRRRDRLDDRARSSAATSTRPRARACSPARPSSSRRSRAPARATQLAAIAPRPMVEDRAELLPALADRSPAAPIAAPRSPPRAPPARSRASSPTRRARPMTSAATTSRPGARCSSRSPRNRGSLHRGARARARYRRLARPGPLDVHIGFDFGVALADAIPAASWRAVQLVPRPTPRPRTRCSPRP